MPVARVVGCMLHTLAIILQLTSICDLRTLATPWQWRIQGGSLGSAEPPILSFCTHASQASWQSKHSWTAEPPFQNPRSATAWCRHSQGWRPIHLKNTSHTKVAGYRDGRFVCTLEKFMLGVCNIDVYAMICTWCCCNTAQQDFTQK